MTTRALYSTLSAGLVLITAAFGYAFGPMAGLGIVGTLCAVAVAVFLLKAPRRHRGTPTPSEGPSVDATPFYRGLAPVLLAAIALRIVMAVFLNATSLWSTFAPDSAYWQGGGAAILAHWSDPSVSIAYWFGTDDARPFFAVVNAVLAAVFGSSRYPPSIVNGLVGLVAAFNFARLANLMYGREAARRTFLVSMFFPSLVLWASMNIREAWSFLLISIALLSTQRLRQRFSPTNLAMLLLSLAGLYFIRAYLVPLVFAGIALSYLVVRPRQLPYALLSLAVIVVVALQVGPSFGLDPALLSEESLETADTLRRGLAYGGSAYGTNVDTRTLGGSLAYLPEGVARFLFGPYPWSVRSALQLMTVPESLIWYWLCFRAAQTLFHDLRHALSKVAPAFFVLAIVTAAYGLVSGNEGTAYRHRAQVMMIVFIFATARPWRRQSN